jgi:hypothetical protein
MTAVEDESVRKTRKSTKFTWGEVDVALMRRLLKEVYASKGDAEQVIRLRGLSDEQVVRQAVRVFGQPPKPKFRKDNLLLGVLRRIWLPNASPGQWPRSSSVL